MCVSYEYIEHERKKHKARKSHGKFKYEINKRFKEKEVVNKINKQNSRNQHQLVESCI